MFETYEQQSFILEARNHIKFVAFKDMPESEQPVIFAIANAGKRPRGGGNKYKCEGVLKGVPDICFTYPNGKYHGLFIEMKRPKGESSTVSKEQRAVIDNLLKYGYDVRVCRGHDEAFQVLKDYISEGRTLCAN